MEQLLVMLGVFVGSLALGYLLISKVPQLLHTPLMSMTNAISAVTLLGGLLIFAGAGSASEYVLGAIALVTASFNVLGGFAITDRMLRFFRKR
ncbi:MAG: NAD(P) transhydrogenase subunit alpha [Bradymonadales bacterium]|nr:NAD(P) transhydrogenase subunit alpha [Bradymonadales bacterium]